MSHPLHSAPPLVKRMEVIVTERAEGAGDEDEPVRIVRYVHTMDGRLLGKLDDLADEKLVNTLKNWSIY